MNKNQNLHLIEILLENNFLLSWELGHTIFTFAAAGMSGQPSVNETHTGFFIGKKSKFNFLLQKTELLVRKARLYQSSLWRETLKQNEERSHMPAVLNKLNLGGTYERR